MRIAQLRASIVGGAGADYHDQPEGHWIDGRIATPMSRYPAYRETRSSFGLNVLGTVVVEVETETGEIGVGVSTGGPPACWLIEHHLSRFVEGADPRRLELIWDQLWRATMFYGRKGLVLNAISAVDLALWDLLGRLRDEPVHALIGGAVHDEVPLYATGPRPDRAKELGFVGGKLPLAHGPADGDAGLRLNLERAAEARASVGDDFFLAYDCWMALDVPYTLRLIEGLRPHRFRWVEEFLPPDDYAGYADVRRRAPRDIMLSTGEHEATRWGFRLLVDMGCCDIVQPDVGWCGGLTELLKIAAYADAHGVLVVPHGSSVYSYHFVLTRPSTPFAEFLMMAPAADRIVPMFSPLFVDEPVPERGHIRASMFERPGFGVELDRSLPLERPFSR
ncbi:MAG: L-rhamnonate dehydratase [Actinobacteria bacterium]|nr:L-rhamnonate dehydratase [Actinomycetota bacterium]